MAVMRPVPAHRHEAMIDPAGHPFELGGEWRKRRGAASFDPS
jgi:hypothetical protein